MNERQNRSGAADFTNTQTFSIADDRDAEVRRIINAVYAAFCLLVRFVLLRLTCYHEPPRST